MAAAEAAERRSAMRFLYAGLEPTDLRPGSLRQNVLSRAAGVRQLGNEADCAYVSGNELAFAGGNGETRRFPLPASAVQREKAAAGIICGLLREKAYRYVYLSGSLVKRSLLAIAACAKERNFGTRVIFELQRYPQREAYRERLKALRKEKDGASRRILRTEMLIEKLNLSNIAKNIDVFVVFGVPVDEIRGIPAITVDTGIFVNEIPPRTLLENEGDPIRILGVVEDPRICGYERILTGLKAYQSNLHRDPVVFDIVGAENDVRGLKELAARLGLGGIVRFPGKKSKMEMDALYNSHTVAVSCMGLFHAGREYFSPRIAKEFCAAGIPFLYAYEDVSLNRRMPFTLKLANLDAPVSIELLSEFVWRCRLNPNLARMERRFAETYYDWRVIMKKILEFTATGRREA